MHLCDWSRESVNDNLIDEVRERSRRQNSKGFLCHSEKFLFYSVSDGEPKTF